MILQGDCLDLMPMLPDASVDMVLCDLPYGTTACKWDTVIPLDRLWNEYRRIVKPNAAIVLTAAQPFTSALVMSAPHLFKHEWVWHKTAASGHLNAKRRPMAAHESVLVFSFGTPPYYPQKTTGHERKVSTASHKRGCVKTDLYGDHGLTSYDSTERYPRSVVTFKSDKQKSALHPTQKPVALLEYLIRTYSLPGQIVLDNAAGSGSTHVACARSGRICWSIEREPKYADTIRQRIEVESANTTTGGKDG